MNVGLIRSIALLGVVTFFLLPGIVCAAGTDLINFSTTPKSPGALEQIVVSIESFAVDLNTANIAWNVDKVFAKDGIAEKTLTVTTPDFGKKMVIDVVILTAAGNKIDKQFVIAPGEVDLLWEAQTYTPPFYKGKALPSFKSLVRITAIPRFLNLTSNPDEYYYKWTFNRNQGVGEALGKNSVVVPMGYANSQIPVMLNVSLPGTDWSGVKNIKISGADPKVVIYERNPLTGIALNRGLRDGAQLTTTETEFTAFAAPYFFSLDDLLNSRLIYTWQVNREYTSPGLFPRNLTIAKNNLAANMLSIHVQNPKRILQEGSANAAVSFTAD